MIRRNILLVLWWCRPLPDCDEVYIIMLFDSFIFLSSPSMWWTCAFTPTQRVSWLLEWYMYTFILSKCAVNLTSKRERAISHLESNSGLLAWSAIAMNESRTTISPYNFIHVVTLSYEHIKLPTLPVLLQVTFPGMLNAHTSPLHSAKL